MKAFDGIPQINTVEELIACLRQSPTTRMLVHSNDLSDNEFDNSGMATRTDDSILLIVDGGSGIGIPPVAIIGEAANRNMWGRAVPEEIKAAMRGAENRTQATELRWVYDGAFALSGHPRAEA